MPVHLVLAFFFFDDTSTTEIYTLSLHDALPIWASLGSVVAAAPKRSSASASQPSRPSTARSYVSSASLDAVVAGRPYASARTDGMLADAPTLGEHRAQEFDRVALRP